MLTIIQVLMLLFLLVFNYYIKSLIGTSIYYVVILSLSFLSYFLLYKIVKGILFKAQEDAQQQAYIKQRELVDEHFLAMKQNEENLLKLKDAILTRAMQDSTLLKKTEEEKKEYLNHLILSFKGMNKLSNCHNKTIDAILYNKALLAESRRVPFHVTALIPEIIGIEPIDLMCVFTNLLDNAIDANKNVDVKSRFVHVHTKVQANYLIIKVENAKPINQTIVVKKHGTSKMDKENHGLGISIIQNTCKKNKGNLYIEDQGTKVIIKAVLRIKEDKAYGK
ncbi:GHKL domain-containing protein [Amedibacillus sp. YH-ame10]